MNNHKHSWIFTILVAAALLPGTAAWAQSEEATTLEEVLRVTRMG